MELPRLNDRPGLISSVVMSLACAGCLHGAPPDSGLKAPSEPDPQEAIASQVPNTDIFLFTMDSADPAIITGLRGNISNRVGYDNQPRFLPASDDLLFTSIHDGRQSDVYRYRDTTAQVSRLTQTAVSEYSPTPLSDGTFSAVVVEEDGTQRLWQYSSNGKPMAAMRAEITGVGYHAFIEEQLMALFIVAEPIRLDITARHGGQVKTIATIVGRSLHATPGQDAFSFVQHDDGAPGMLSLWPKGGEEIVALVAMPAGVEDMVWLPDGRALTVANGVLMVWQEGQTDWRVARDLQHLMPGKASRLAVNDAATRIAIVSELE